MAEVMYAGGRAFARLQVVVVVETHAPPPHLYMRHSSLCARHSMSAVVPAASGPLAGTGLSSCAHTSSSRFLRVAWSRSWERVDSSSRSVSESLCGGREEGRR